MGGMVLHPAESMSTAEIAAIRATGFMESS
jgi:hypothetical protein